MRQSWEIRDAKIRKDSTDYYINFMLHSQTAKEARAEGWEPWLKRYIHAVAYVQAQFIHGQENFGVEWHIVLENPYSDEECRDFMRKAKSDSAYGINVGIPTSKIKHWKYLAQCERAKYEEKKAA